MKPITLDTPRLLLRPWREALTLAPLILLIFWIGLYPKPFFHLMAASADRIAEAMQVAALAAR